MSELVVSGLVKRRAALAGEIEATHETLRKMVADLENLDATIVQFDPDFKVETIKHKGAFSDLEVSAEEANALIIAARVKAGWIEAPTETPAEEPAEPSQAEA